MEFDHLFHYSLVQGLLDKTNWDHEQLVVAEAVWLKRSHESRPSHNLCIMLLQYVLSMSLEAQYNDNDPEIFTNLAQDLPEGVPLLPLQPV
jgi:hypothetical protein